MKNPSLRLVSPQNAARLLSENKADIKHKIIKTNNANSYGLNFLNHCFILSKLGKKPFSNNNSPASPARTANNTVRIMCVASLISVMLP